MTIDSSSFVGHMAWANQAIFARVATAPDVALSAYMTNPEWTAGHILRHIVDGAEWFVYCLGVKPWDDVTAPVAMSDVPVLARRLEGLDRRILAESHKDDERIVIAMEQGVKTVWRSTLIAQAVHHATEHRAQLVDALESGGHLVVNLDDFDVWAYAAAQSEGRAGGGQ